MIIMDKAAMCERIVFSEHAGDEMKKIREERRLRQKDLAIALQISPQALSKREKMGKTVGVGVVRQFIQAINL